MLPSVKAAALGGEAVMQSEQARKALGSGERCTSLPRAALKLQGHYIGTMRELKPGQRAQKRIKEAKGYEAAIRAAERTGGIGQ